MDVETAARTDPGRVRDHNEDSVLVTERAGRPLFAVADGMGGHSAGDVASEVALAAFADAAAEEFEAGAATDAALAAAAREANAAVREAARDGRGEEGMGTTLVAACLDGGTATLVNVGDSRAYHVTPEGIEQVTVDQSMVQELVDEGVIDPEEAADHPQRNVVSQALGTAESVDPDVYEVSLDGVLLLCSDGLPEEVPESEIREVIAEVGGSDAGLDAVADALVARANDHGGSDNISVVLAERA